MLRLSDAYTWATKAQEQGVKIATHCFKEATQAAAELAQSQCQERKFIDRVLDHFQATYDTPN